MKDRVTLPREVVASLIDRIRGLEISLMHEQSTDFDKDSARIEGKHHERMRDLLGVPIPELEPELEFCPGCDGLHTLGGIDSCG